MSVYMHTRNHKLQIFIKKLYALKRELHILKCRLLEGHWTEEEKSRGYFILEGITGIGQFSLTTGAFLAGFVSFLGGSESVNGMLGVVPAAAGMFQIFAGLIMPHGKSRKETIVKWVILLRILLSIIYFVPFVVMNFGAGTNVVLGSYIICFVTAYVVNSLVTPHIAGWLIDLAPMRIRGRYFALRDRISLLIIAITTIVLGRVLDYNEALGQEFIGFVVVGIVLTIMGMINIYSVMRIQDVESFEVKSESGFIKNLLKPLQDQVFKKVIRFYMLWNFALQIGGPYIGVYMVEDLNLSYTYMMSMTVLGTIIRVVFASRWGKIADRKSWLASSKMSLLVLGVTHFTWFFVTTGNSMVLVPILNVMAGIAWGGVAISLFNVQYLYANAEFRTLSIGVNAAIGGMMSLIAVRIGGVIMDYISIQSTFAISGLLIIGCAVYILLVLKPEEMRNL